MRSTDGEGEGADKRDFLMNEPETIDPRELNPLALAFVGDSVLELLVRTRPARHHRMSAGKLNVEKVKYVSARAQFREEQLLEPLFTEEELAVFKRGRNASKASVAKHASPRNTALPPALSACWAGSTSPGRWPVWKSCSMPCGSSLTRTRNKTRKPAAFRTGKQCREGSGLSYAVLLLVLGTLVVSTLGILVGVLVLVGGLIGGAVLALVLAVVRAVFGAILAVVLHGSLLLS